MTRTVRALKQKREKFKMQMKRNITPSTLLVFLLIFHVTFSINSVEARKHQTKKAKPHKHHKGGNGTRGSHSPCPPPTPVPQDGSFSIMSFGTNGDGVYDDSKALIEAWKAACKVNGASVEIPSGFKFLIKPLTLQGPCMPHLVLQIDGTLMAPPKVGSWSKSTLYQWINFKWINNFTIQGGGVVDGQGFDWWRTTSLASSSVYYLQKLSNKHIPNSKPTALRFYSSFDVTVRDIRIINSPQCHLKFDSSGQWIKVDNITISSPETSPYTDGIHLQNTQNVEIHHSTIGCGDDCVSIQTGCSNVHVHHISCGPGHGISLGGLGKERSVACVSSIVVNDISFQNTLSGVRIKTWQGGIGSVKNVSFSNIQVSDVKVPVMIDQYYCDKKSCKNQTGAVAISGVKYDRIIGTYSVQPVHLACSRAVPCTDVDLIDIQLKPSAGYQRFQNALCWNSFGKSQGPLVPSSIDYCLSKDANPVRGISRSHDHQHLC